MVECVVLPVFIKTKEMKKVNEVFNWIMIVYWINQYTENWCINQYIGKYVSLNWIMVFCDRTKRKLSLEY